MIALCVSAAPSSAQPSAVPSTPPVGAKKSEKKEKASPGPANPLFSGTKGTQSNEPVTTEIYADDAFFDSNKNIGIFTGLVKVVDQRFTLQYVTFDVYFSIGA